MNVNDFRREKMDIGVIRLGENVYALINKNAFAMNENEDSNDEVFVTPAVVVGVHVDNGVTVRSDNFTFLVPVDCIFYNRIEADDVALKYNKHIKDIELQEQEFTVCVRATGTTLVTVRAKDAEMARCRASGKVCDMYFGDLEDVDWDGVYAEDSHGNRVDF